VSSNRNRRGLLAAGTIAILIAGVAVVTLASSAKTSLQDVSEGLTCQCGCGLTVANCNHPQCEFSVPVRLQIEQMIGRGMGRGEIIAFFRAKYGEKILSAPTTEGFNLLAWIMPFAAVFAGCFIIVGAISRWRTREVPEQAGSVHSLATDDAELKRRLAQEIRDER
jgi:cytochrome c-type biogenesis protein CcmH